MSVYGTVSFHLTLEVFLGRLFGRVSPPEAEIPHAPDILH